jgi:hypothetical protein
MDGKAIFINLGGFQVYGFVTDGARRDMRCGVRRHFLASSAESRRRLHFLVAGAKLSGNFDLPAVYAFAPGGMGLALIGLVFRMGVLRVDALMFDLQEFV